ncbi:FAD-binding oxidoreductase [Paenibacillus lignilyticus]|uniref:FAD-binding oxidoreductase n=1 Tax=Paenibacillus lignilyticus TaxID=1172615 RepID=A0ABS5CGW5_9BACL|nr:FAD-binding oxidoreductase [Paenibacillus lignilyticus]MBP3965128.1 FAD-binding oxidoreductase [Paenibacillus lignilyticus]
MIDIEPSAGPVRKFRSGPVILLAIIIYVSLLAGSVMIRLHAQDSEYASDVSRLMEVRIFRTVHVHETADIKEALAEAKRRGLPISVSGASHSQGGQTFMENAIVLDMKPYHRIIQLDEKRKEITVQSGATWEQIQEALNPFGLSVRIMQSQNLFTVGGTMSVNAHGRDIREGPFAQSVQSFRLMKADGDVVQVSRTEDPELFANVIGGYGLFGVILDVTLDLTEDEVYMQHVVPVHYEAFPELFNKEVLEQPSIAMAIARLSVSPDSFLTDMFVTTYERTDVPLNDNLRELREEKFASTGITKFVFGLSRKSEWGKELVWKLQKKGYLLSDGDLISRNNAMRPAAKFMEYADTQRTDLLQEYFVPLDRFKPFVDGMRTIMREDKLNLLNITVRYVPRNEESTLSYAKHDSFAFVLLFNNKRSAAEVEKLAASTRRLIDLALRHDGTYYLPYQLFADGEQLRAAYPKTDAFFEAKRRVDPGLLFQNELYARYAK